MTGPDGQTVYVAYRERWLVLLNLSILIAGCFLVQYAFGPISIYVTQYYEVNGDKIDLIQGRNEK